MYAHAHKTHLHLHTQTQTHTLKAMSFYGNLLLVPGSETLAKPDTGSQRPPSHGGNWGWKLKI